MGKRGPKPDILTKLTPAQRAELDEAIIGGAGSKQELAREIADDPELQSAASCG